MGNKHAENTAFNCRNCETNLKHRSESENHINSEHRSKTKSKCDDCSERIPKSSNLDNHTEEMHLQDPEVDNKCSKCEQRFTLEEELNEHMVIFHADRVFNCQKCDKPYESMSLLRRHDWRSHREIECNICGESIKSRTDNKSHRETKHKMYKKVYCKFFPDCIDGEECLYEHVKGSNEVSYCQNGLMCNDQECKCSDQEHTKQKVLCIFQENCKRLDCPYTHTVKRKAFLDEDSVGIIRH